MPYYGYIHECAELMLQLDKKSREIWLGNLQAIMVIIFDHSKATMVKKINDELSLTRLRMLKINSNYLYFRLCVRLGSETSFRTMISFIEMMGEVCLEDQFEIIFIAMEPRTIEICQVFLNKYLEKGLNKKALMFDYSSTIYELRNSKDKELSYINYTPFKGYIEDFTINAVSEEYLTKSDEIETLYIRYLWYSPRILDKNYNCLSVSPKVLTDFEAKILSYKFVNKSCITLELYKGGIYFDKPIVKGEIEDIFGSLNIVSGKLNNLQNFRTRYTSLFEFVCSQKFFRLNKGFPHLSKIKGFEFKDDVGDELIGLQYKCPQAEIVFQDPEELNIHVFVVENLELKLKPQEFCYDSKNKILVLKDNPSGLSFQNIKDYRRGRKTEKYRLEICGKVYLKLPITDPILKPEGHFPPNHSSQCCSMNSKPRVMSITNVISKGRPHYIFRLYFNDKEYSETLSMYLLCQFFKEEDTIKLQTGELDCFNCFSEIPRNGLVSVHIYNHPEQSYKENEMSLINNNTKETATKVDLMDVMCDLIERIKDLSIDEFTCEMVLKNDRVLQKFCELCEHNCSIKSIKLKPYFEKDVKKILKALRNNFMIKSISLMHQEIQEIPVGGKSLEENKQEGADSVYLKPIQVSHKTVSYCKKFRNKRIGTQIMLNPKIECFRKWENESDHLFEQDSPCII
ncbi:unnamed protein product [Moneuplotes crassus]|uniref:Uncharacterized protein n=1 Tax=Euplotes crassus TaxID=5936 RepID=A0AAD1TYQ4_EUPCR|nr:unnamed protein product [Moneuplotes crassus]